MKKLRLKRYVLPTFFATLGLVAIVVALAVTKPDTSLNGGNNLNYVSNVILSQEVPVLNTTPKVIYPFTDPSVTIGKNYYDYQGKAEDQEKSIIFHENTYMQNSGIDFVYENKFDVISVLDGTVTNVKEDEVLGKIVEVNHGNDFVSIYQSLSEVKVKKGDTVTQGQILGISGTNELDKELGNHLHFEFYAGGQIVNPSLYLDKELQAQKEEE